MYHARLSDTKEDYFYEDVNVSRHLNVCGSRNVSFRYTLPLLYLQLMLSSVRGVQSSCRAHLSFSMQLDA